MDPALWSRVKDIAFEALDLEPGARWSYLERACDGDAVLRAEVEKIVRAHDAAESRDFLDPPSIDLGSATSRPRTDAGGMIGARIGRYRVRRLIGVGGMGAVYEAVQEQPRRTVALKVMRSGLASRSAQRRFEYESQLLARLRHPGIAQVYEAGAHEGPHGVVPFFAMEYIPGARPITQYARERKLSVAERLALMVRVCEAVHHGHQKGVVHRDLKPSNILVDSSGNPRIIDFGVARASDADLVVTTLQTDAGQLVGTLQYMSPEQCAADPTDIDTRSDVYSLGVVLYELLTGRPPYDVAGVPVYEAPRIIREQPPERPSSINPDLRGDLQIIMLKALEKDRTQRYQSAADLGLDLRRYLDGEAIAARPPSVAYQLRVLARRHRPLFISAGAVALALFAGIVIAAIGLTRAIHARDDAQKAAVEARAQAARAARIANFLKGTIGSIDPALAAASDPASVLALDPEYSPWETRRQSSWEYAGRPGEPPTAIDLLRAAAKRMDRTFPDDPSIRGELAFLIGRTLAVSGAVDEAIPLLRTAVELQRQTLGPDRESTIAAMLELGGVLSLMGQYDEAAEPFQAAFDACRRTFGLLDPRTLEAGRQRTMALAMIPRRRDEAVALQRDVIDLLSRRLEPDNILTLIEVTHLARLLEACGRIEEAEEVARRATDGLMATAGPDRRPTIDAQGVLAYILRSRGGTAALLEAERLLQSGVSFYERRISPDYDGVNELRKWQIEILFQLGRHADAVPIARRILESHRRIYGPNSLAGLKSASRLARCQIAAGMELEEAEVLARHAAEMTPAVTSPTEDYAVYHGATYADALRVRGRPEEGLRTSERLLDLIGPGAPRTAAWTLAYLRGVQAQCLADLGRSTEAREAFIRALADADGWPDPVNPIRLGIIRAGIRYFERSGDGDLAAAWRGRLPIP